jgi:FMN phosphatase YigB (HAD superfamily)
MILGKKMTLIFDLDETLVHCEHNKMLNFDHIVSIHAPSGEIVDVRNFTTFHYWLFARPG